MIGVEKFYVVIEQTLKVVYLPLQQELRLHLVRIQNLQTGSRLQRNLDVVTQGDFFKIRHSLKLHVQSLGSKIALAFDLALADPKHSPYRVDVVAKLSKHGKSGTLRLLLL